MVAMDFFEASNFYDFFNQYCLNLLKNPTVRGLICENDYIGIVITKKVEMLHLASKDGLKK